MSVTTCYVGNATYFRYAQCGTRLSKTTSQSGNPRPAQQVQYLPALEARNGQASDRLMVIIANNLRILCTNQPPRCSYICADRNGNGSLELDGSGNIISHQIWYPFGGAACHNPRALSPYQALRYSGKECDASGLIFYGFRYYVSWLLRWLNPDPAGSVDGLNPCIMVNNNPLTWRDGDGRIHTPPPRQNEPLSPSAAPPQPSRHASPSAHPRMLNRPGQRALQPTTASPAVSLLELNVENLEARITLTSSSPAALPANEGGNSRMLLTDEQPFNANVNPAGTIAADETPPDYTVLPGVNEERLMFVDLPSISETPATPPPTYNQVLAENIRIMVRDDNVTIPSSASGRGESMIRGAQETVVMPHEENLPRDNLDQTELSFNAGHFLVLIGMLALGVTVGGIFGFNLDLFTDRIFSVLASIFTGMGISGLVFLIYYCHTARR